MNVRTTQVPGELVQYNGWTGPELLELVSRLETENERLKALLSRVARVLQELERYNFYCWSAQNEKLLELIRELREAAE